VDHFYTATKPRSRGASWSIFAPALIAGKLKAATADVLENAENALTPMMRNLIGMLWEEWKTVEGQIDELTDRLEQIAASDAGCCRIRQIPGIRPIVATAIVAAIGNGAAFRKGRDFAVARLGSATLLYGR
jgi:transposase